MRIAVKSVSGPAKQYEVEPSMKVLDLKKEIEKEQNYPLDRQKLIFSGKVLADDDTLESNNITDGRFLVVMVTKAVPAPASTISPAKSAAEPTPAEGAPAAPATSAPSASAPAADTPTADPASVAAVTTEQPSASAEDSSGDFYHTNASTLSAGPALDGHVTQMVDMGFERSEVLRAMRAAFNNPDRAVEYLMSGIPETAEAAPPVAAMPPSTTAVGTPASESAVSAPAAAPTDSARPNAQPLDMFPQGFPAAVAGGESGGGGSGNSLAFLRSNPQFQGLRQVVQNNPAILQPMLAELGRRNPQLLALINSNQDEFLRLVSEPVGEGTGGDSDAGGLADMMADDPEFDDAAAAGGQTIQVTAEEAESIERLQALGFPRNACIEAFFACDKNESLAANFLLGDGSWD